MSFSSSPAADLLADRVAVAGLLGLVEVHPAEVDLAEADAETEAERLHPRGGQPGPAHEVAGQPRVAADHRPVVVLLEADVQQLVAPLVAVAGGGQLHRASRAARCRSAWCGSPRAARPPAAGSAPRRTRRRRGCRSGSGSPGRTSSSGRSPRRPGSCGGAARSPRARSRRSAAGAGPGRRTRRSRRHPAVRSGEHYASEASPDISPHPGGGLAKIVWVACRLVQ